jgi:predicted adenine nucleotide alpha hydrolase (AANH) superfamily ATPase
MFVIDDLREYFKDDKDFRIWGLYANPNIHPYDEFLRRLENAEKACEIKSVPLSVLTEFNQGAWENFSGAIEERCKMCYRVRMELVAKFAAENGFKRFSTTLLVSPYQNHEAIRIAGEAAAERYGVEFFFRDYSRGFREGQRQAKEAGLYRQKYCGCIRSKEYK